MTPVQTSFQSLRQLQEGSYQFINLTPWKGGKRDQPACLVATNRTLTFRANSMHADRDSRAFGHTITSEVGDNMEKANCVVGHVVDGPTISCLAELT